MRAEQLPLESDWARQFVFDEPEDAVLPYARIADPEPHLLPALAPTDIAKAYNAPPPRPRVSYKPRRRKPRYYLRNGVTAAGLLTLSVHFPDVGILLSLVAAVLIASAWRDLRRKGIFKR